MTAAPPSTSLRIRRATVPDVPAVGRIINESAERKLMLHRSLTTLYEGVRDFQVAVDAEERVVGVCGLKVVWAHLSELYALAVDPSHRGAGLGRRLAEASLDDAREVGTPQVMTLTYEQRFFDKLGFAVVDRTQLPLKVWRECLACPKNNACDEIAMVAQLEGVPEPPTPDPEAPDPGDYVVPVTLENRARRGQAGRERENTSGGG